MILKDRPELVMLITGEMLIHWRNVNTLEKLVWPEQGHPLKGGGLLVVAQ